MPLAFHDPRHWLEIVPRTLAASPLYSAFWEKVRHDPDLLTLLDLIEKDQPLPITLFTAVNYLVLGELAAPLAQCYPSLSEQTRPASEAGPLFREFVRSHEEVLRTLLPTARLQTNEVTRCANLLPAFLLVYQQGEQRPLNMVEIGSSVGLNLLWPQYCYQYRQSVWKGGVKPEAVRESLVNDVLTLVQVSCDVEMEDHQNTFPVSSIPFPSVARCQGIEVCPRDMYNEQDIRWLRAAIWPEEVERYRRLDTALAFARRMPPQVHAGDACALLPGLLAAIPADHTAVVWHSFALEQGSEEVKERIHSQLLTASSRQPLYRVGLEMDLSLGQPLLTLAIYQDGQVVRHDVLARCSLHGERMTWLLK